MYPAYTVRTALDEYAVTFFALLNEGYRQRYANYLMLAQLADLPQMDESNRKTFYRNLQWASSHPSDILKTSGDGSSPAEIKKLLGGK